MNSPSQADCDELVSLLNAGQFVALESRARALAERHPASGFAWKMLWVSLHKQGREALDVLRKVADLSPGDAAVLYNLGNAYADAGQIDQAMASYLGALEAKPDFAEAYHNLGAIHRDLGATDEAISCFRQALRIRPDYVAVLNKLGNILADQDKPGEAAACFQRAVEARPDDPESNNNLATCLIHLGRYADAKDACSRILGRQPHLADAHCNLGIALTALGQLDEAVGSYRRALQLRPEFAEAYCNLGIALTELGKFHEAAATLRRAIEINPALAEAHCNLGNVCKEFGQIDEAIAEFRQALQITPSHTRALSSLLFVFNYLPGLCPDTVLAHARRFGELVSRRAPPTHPGWPNDPDPDRRLQVGLVSGDLCHHPVGYFIEGILAAAAKASGRIDFTAYYSHHASDDVTDRIRICCKRWRSVVGFSDAEFVETVRSDGIDILIDLSGHSAHNRLAAFAWRPAPLQVTWLGYFATTGVAEMDYLLADPISLPERMEAQFTERIWRLPETRLCFTPPNEDVAAASLPACANGHITFGCFNALAKMNDEVVKVWAKILSLVPGSRLFLKTKQLGDSPVRDDVVGRFAALGITEDRLILEGASSRARYLAAYNDVDISLDPFPFPGGTTTVESLWMGVPVLTLCGENLVSRQGASLLTNAGLPEWVADDTDDYVRRAVSYAGDLEHLAQLRSQLRQRVLKSPIFDAARFVHHLEAALRGMWSRWCKNGRRA